MKSNGIFAVTSPSPSALATDGRPTPTATAAAIRNNALLTVVFIKTSSCESIGRCDAIVSNCSEGASTPGPYKPWHFAENAMGGGELDRLRCGDCVRRTGQTATAQPRADVLSCGNGGWCSRHRTCEDCTREKPTCV